MDQILFVDDDENILAGFQRQLRKEFTIRTAVGPIAGLEAVAKEGPFALVVADMQMPDMNGLEFLKLVEARAPNTVRIMLTGNVDQKTAMDAVNDGHVFRFLTKPCPAEILVTAVRSGLRQYQLLTAERDLLEKTLSGAIGVLLEILEKVNPKLTASSRGLRDQIRHVARALQVAETWEVEVASMLSEVGFVTIPPAVILKSGAGLALTEAEKGMVEAIPQASSNLINKIPRLENVARIILYSRKDFDGSGFPRDERSGESIPIGARILRVVTDLNKLRNGGASASGAVQSMKQQVGTYDPQVLAALLATLADRPVDDPALQTLRAERSSEPKPADSTVIDKGSAKPRRVDDPVLVLVVDDKPAIAEQIRSGLKDTPWKVMAQAQPATALDFCSQQTPDAIMVSLLLPERRGFKFVQSLRASPSTKGVPIFAMCVKTAVEEQAEAQQLGLSGIVTKPIDIEDLKAKISRALKLDTSGRYFQQRDGVLLVNVPESTSPTAVNELTVHVRTQISDAVDAGIDKVVIDFSDVGTADISLVKLGLEVTGLSRELSLKCRMIGSNAIKQACQNYEETKEWRFEASYQAAIASFGHDATTSAAA